MSTKCDKSPLVGQYFLPEIIEEAPEIYEKELKYSIPSNHTKESLQEFKELRKKYFKFVHDCFDYQDPSYKEIEKDLLRLSIKMDDIDTFQKFLSNTSTPFDTKIKESLVENFQYCSSEYSLIEFAVTFDSVKIIKFLIMNNVKFCDCAFLSILNGNYDIIHLLEPQLKNEFEKDILIGAITSCDNELVEYAISNYDFDFITKSDIDSEYYERVIIIIIQTFLSKNIDFFDSFVLPFLFDNPSFVKKNIDHIILLTCHDSSCFFLNMFLQYPSFDINFRDEVDKHTFLTFALSKKNVKAVEIFLKDEKINVNLPGFSDLTPFQYACFACLI